MHPGALEASDAGGESDAALPYFSPIARSFSRASASAWPCALAWAVIGGIVLVGNALLDMAGSKYSF